MWSGVTAENALGIWNARDMAADSPESGNLQVQELEVWESRIQKKMKVLRMRIHSAQNVGKVLISRKKTYQPHLRQFWMQLSIGRTHTKFGHVFMFLIMETCSVT